VRLRDSLFRAKLFICLLINAEVPRPMVMGRFKENMNLVQVPTAMTGEKGEPGSVESNGGKSC